MRYSDITEEQKIEMYSLARAGAKDSYIMSIYMIDEDILLRCLEDAFCAVQQSRGFIGIVKLNLPLRGD